MNTTENSRGSKRPRTRQTWSPIVELRKYTLHPGTRDVLIELFDQEFVETQEAVGMKVIGQFRDLDDPDCFVWLRGFPDMPTRGRALEAFYGGPVWKKHRDAANATMIDSDNVLLLRPASGSLLEDSNRPPPGADQIPKGLVVVTIYQLRAAAEVDFLDFFERALRPALTNAGASIVASLVTERSANNFPALPVREGENVLVSISLFPDDTAYEQHVAALARSQRWHDELGDALAQRLNGEPEVWKLTPTARSQLRG